MSNAAWLIVALAVVFVAVGGYSALLIARARTLSARFESLSRDVH